MDCSPSYAAASRPVMNTSGRSLNRISGAPAPGRATPRAARPGGPLRSLGWLPLVRLRLRLLARWVGWRRRRRGWFLAGWVGRRLFTGWVGGRLLAGWVGGRLLAGWVGRGPLARGVAIPRFGRGR